MRSLIQVEREISNSEGETRIDRQYYISSLPPEDCQLIGQYIRGHWGIENRLHWHLDVTFREDACRARKDYSATNLNTLRKWSIGQIAGYYFHVVVLWVKLQATVLGVCWAIFLSL